MAEKGCAISNKKIQVPKVESNTMQQPKVLKSTNYYYKGHVVEAATDYSNIKNDDVIIEKLDDHKVLRQDDFNQEELEEDYFDYKQFKIGYFLRSLTQIKGVTKDEEYNNISNSSSRVVHTEQDHHHHHHHFDLSGVGACEAPYSTYKISCYLNALSDAYTKQDGGQDGGRRVCKKDPED